MGTSPALHKPYKEATVYNGAREWFVQYHYWDLKLKRYIRDKVRLDVKGLSPAERLKALTVLCEEFNNEIKINNERGIYHIPKNTPNAGTGENIIYFIDLALQDEDISQDRKETYISFKGNLIEFFAQHPAFELLHPSGYDTEILKLFRKALQGKKLAGKTINKYLAAFDTLTEYMKIKGLGDHVITTKHLRLRHPKNETGRYPPLTVEEQIKALTYFRDKFPNYYLFLCFMYYTCIRPDELHRLKIKNIDLQGKKISVPWFDAKNGLSKWVQILEPLEQALIDYKVKELDNELYLFTDRCLPGKEYYDGNYTSDIWARNRVKMEMPKEKQMYGLKHTFNVNYVENNKHNIEWEWLRRHNRHATIQQTQEYISGLSAYFLDETKSVILNFHSAPGQALRKKKAE